MADEYIRLAEAPQWCLQSPTCSACTVDLENDGDGWMCQVCGTYWGNDANDGDTGTLYADWNGEESTGPIVSKDRAIEWGAFYENERRHRLLPQVFPAPIRPDAKTGV